MPTLLEKVEITNFKSCSNTCAPLANFTPLIGYNNSGKSNIISAIHWLLRKSVLDESSFHNAANPVEVVGYISGITDTEIASLIERQQEQIKKYITGGNLKIRRFQPLPGGKTADIIFSVWDFNANSWVPNPTGIDNAIGVLLPDPIRIGAMENAEEDASKARTTTTIGKLLSEFINPVKDAHEQELNQHLNEVDRRLSANGDTRLAELNTIDISINEKINDLFPGMGIKLHFPVPNISELIKSGTVKVYEGTSDGRGFSSYGHGAQRSIQMALVRHLAEVRRTTAGHNLTTLLLIDEPELYLHPFAIEQVREALKTLAKNGYQVIISTHSAQMVTATDAQNTLLVRKSQALGTHTRMRLHDAIQKIVPNSIHQMEHLFTLGNSSQVLFSDRVILTEGKTELRLMPSIVKSVLGKTLGQEKTALVAQDGVCNTKKSMAILQAMDIPSKAIVDLDYAMEGAVTHGFINPQDTAVAAIKKIFSRLEAAGNITLNPSTKTPKNGIISTSAAYSLMAAEADAIQPIEDLHGMLLKQNIWLWKKGAIESHLGLSEKNEFEWAKFQIKLEGQGLEQSCPDHVAISSMVTWAFQ